MKNKIENDPLKIFQCGRIKAAIWIDQRVINNTIVDIHTVKIDRSYKDGEQWKHTNTFNIEDLPKVALVANEAYKYVRLRTLEPDKSQNNKNDDFQREQNDNLPVS